MRHDVGPFEMRMRALVEGDRSALRAVGGVFGRLPQLIGLG